MILLTRIINVFIVIKFIIPTKDWSEVVVHVGEVIPSRVDIIERTPVKLYCGSVSPVVWNYKNYGSITYIILNYRTNITKLSFQFQILNNTIILNNLRNGDSGLIHCDGTYRTSIGKVRPFLNYAPVNVLDFAPSTCLIPNVVEVSVGDDVNLTCGTDKGVEWFGLNLDGQEKTKHDNTLVLRNLRKEHSGPYICRGVYNGRIFHSGAAVVIVEGYVHYVHYLRKSIDVVSG